MSWGGGMRICCSFRGLKLEDREDRVGREERGWRGGCVYVYIYTCFV